MKTKSLIFGHSHVWPINKAIATGAYKPRMDNYEVDVLLCGTQQFPDDIVLFDKLGKKRLNPCITSVLSTHKAQDEELNNVLISMVQGNYYNQVALIQEKDHQFDFIVPGHESLPVLKDVDIVPYTAISDSLAEKAGNFPSYLKLLKSLGYKTALHIGSPPPPENNDLILEEVIKRTGPDETTSVVDASVRLKLWLTQNAFMRAYCRKYDIIFLEAPKSTKTKSGFLKPEYIKDSVHGNYKYAVLVLEDIEDSLSKREK